MVLPPLFPAVELRKSVMQGLGKVKLVLRDEMPLTLHSDTEPRGGPFCQQQSGGVHRIRVLPVADGLLFQSFELVATTKNIVEPR